MRDLDTIAHTRGPARSGRIALWLAVVLLVTAACGGRKVVVPPPTTAKKSTPPKPEPKSPPATARQEPAPKTPDRAAVPPVLSPDGMGPIMRIGIFPAQMYATITSEAPYYLQAKASDASRIPVNGTITVSLDGQPGPAQETHTIFRVQIASLSRAKDAEALRRRLEEENIQPVLVQFNPDAAAYRIRVGHFESLAAANQAVDRLRARYRQAMVVRESPSASAPGAQPVALRASGPAVSQRARAGFRIIPSTPEGFIKVNGKPYRGIIETRPGRNGKLAVINELAMEEYLKGVVPEELPPGAFPEPEALKAQAVAARSYALRHRGQFESEGYDLLASERSQVYGGVASEHPLSTQAVLETAGLALWAGGEWIDALYTSTCGGRTEDFQNMFGGQPVPYLRGVICAPDQGSEGEPAIPSSSRSDGVLRNGGTKGLPSELALLRVLGVLSPRALSDAELAEIPAREEITQWVGRTAQVLKRKPMDTGGPRTPLERLAYFCAYLVEQIFSRQAAEVLLSEADAQYYLAGFRDHREIPSPARRMMAFLIQKSILIPYPDNTLRPQQALARRSVLGMLYRTLEALSALSLESGQILKWQDTSLQIKTGRDTLAVRPAANLYLFRRIGKELIATEVLRVIGGEEVRFHRSDGFIDYLEVKLSAGGAANDRFSRFTQWEVGMTADEAAKKLSAVFKLGRLIDMQPVKYGVSNRVIELKVMGSQGEFSLKGLRIRRVLGLRDTLFTIAREQGDRGEASRFIFTGRGWGHGVGLCQTGAYGMALAGERFDAILKKYYTGVEVKRAY